MTAGGGTSGQQTDLHKIFYQCRLGRDDIERMFAMACEGIPAPAVRVSTVAGNTRFWKPTLQDLVTAVHDNAPEIGAHWTNLSLDASSPSLVRGVRITIDKERTEVNVSGSDTTWAFGQVARIEKFLTSRGAVSSSPRYENRVMYIALLFFLAFGTFLLVHGVDNETANECITRVANSTKNAKVVNSLIVVTYAFGTLFPIYQIMKRRSLRARLDVIDNLPTGPWWSRLSPAEKIAVIGVPIAALATIAALVTAANDLWGK
ncbi:hypothetical protein [Streptomyces bugieae]|uniref:Uncharacterized protein n=1 Tax=Streptomyces bugieae TaxID=3098223 RepID=A0ABU7NPT5_9ACTN|nr:hypothetical protein [Streptomyces sp. DSM 41528]